METKVEQRSMPKFNSVRSNAVIWFVALLTCIAVSFGLPAISAADEADVVDVKISKTGKDKFRIDASVKHADTGWDHYSNKFEVLDGEGNVLGTRVLHHPHVNEQPFTRSLTLQIPQAIKEVVVRAGDSVHETGGAEITIAVPHDGE